MLRTRICATMISCLAAALIAASPVSAASPSVVVAHSSAMIVIPNGGGDYVVTQFAVDPGTWWVTMTGTLTQSAGPNIFGSHTSCRIVAGSDTDSAQWAMTANDEGRSVASVYLTLVHKAGSQFNVDLVCSSTGPGTLTLSNLRISALKGQLTGSGSPRLASVSDDSSHGFAGDDAFHTVGTLDLPAGRWWIAAKTNIVSGVSNATSRPICRIKLGSADTDQTQVGLFYTTQQGYEEEAAVQLGHAFSGAGSARLQCSSKEAFSTDHVRIVAIKAGKLTRKSFGGSTSSSGSGTPTVITGSYEKAPIAQWLTIPHSTSYSTLGSLTLPAGTWFVSAKLGIKSPNHVEKIDCRLVAGSDTDSASSRGGPDGAIGTYLQLGHTFSSSGKVDLRCRANANGIRASFVRITAVSAASLAKPTLNV